jgi:hypothetical protein
MLGRALRAAPRGSFRPKGRRSAVVTVGATSITMNGPTSGTVGLASSPFAIGVNGTVGTNIVVTPSDGGGGTFSVPSVTLTPIAPSATFTYTPGSIGSRTISVTSNPVLAYPPAITFTATGVTALVWGSYPTSGTVSVASTPFTISANGPVGTSIVVTMSDNAGGGTFNPTPSVTLTTGSPSATFTYTPASTGAKTISVTNVLGLTPPGNITYTATDTTWTTTVPAISFTQGSASTRDLTQYTTGFNSSLHQMAVTSGTLPSGVTLNPAGTYVYNGSGAVASATPIVLTIQDTAETDWLARSTAAGVTFAYDMDTQAYYSGAWNAFSFSAHKVANGLNPTYLAQLTQDATDGPNGRCMRIDYPAAQGDTSAELVLPLNGAWTSYTQGMGATQFYIQFRFKIPASRLAANVITAGVPAFKWAIVGHFDPQDISGHSKSNDGMSVVLEDTYQRDFPSGYNYGVGGAYKVWEDTFGSDIRRQNQVDNGVGLPDAQRYCLYSTGPSYPGCIHWTTDEWVTFKMRIKVATSPGTTGNLIDLWYARKDALAWTHLVSYTNQSIGVSSYPGGLNGLHLTGYSTGRTSALLDTHMKWAQVIVSTNDIALPGVGA